MHLSHLIIKKKLKRKKNKGGNQRVQLLEEKVLIRKIFFNSRLFIQWGVTKMRKILLVASSLCLFRINACSGARLCRVEMVDGELFLISNSTLEVQNYLLVAIFHSFTPGSSLCLCDLHITIQEVNCRPLSNFSIQVIWNVSTVIKSFNSFGSNCFSPLWKEMLPKLVRVKVHFWSW